MQVLSNKLYLCFMYITDLPVLYMCTVHAWCLYRPGEHFRFLKLELRTMKVYMWHLRLLKKLSFLAGGTFIMKPPLYFQFALIYDFLCSVKAIQLHETVSTLKHEILGDLNLCSCAVPIKHGSRIKCLLHPLSWDLLFSSICLCDEYTLC